MNIYSSAKLQVDELQVNRSDKKVLNGISFSVNSSEVYALLGGNGAGKSTTLLSFLGFLPPAGGSVSVNGVDVGTDMKAAREAIAYLPESAALYEHLDAYENLHYFLQLARVDVDRAAIEAALNRVSLAPESRGRKLREYSKGMRQKVAIALAILRDTEILLLDEPTSGLDPSAIDEFHDLVRDLADSGKTILMVTHDVYGACPGCRPNWLASRWQTRRRILCSGRWSDRNRSRTSSFFGSRIQGYACDMSEMFTIAMDEWRYWRRSKLALAVVAVFVAILVSVTLLTTMRMHAESHERAHHQDDSEQTFLSQPDRHPHRMVHYGHYLFRAPMPLAVFDPGLDSVTGKAIFLEGHRQNSATFSAAASSADIGGLSWLTPALIYQIFAPLLIIVLGHGAVVRERESGALATLFSQGLSGRSLLAGKGLALFLFVLLLLGPLVVSVLIALSDGETLLPAASLVGVYFAYLLIWVGLTLLSSSVLHKRSSIIATLAAFWLALTLVLPAVAVSVAARVAPLAGKIETELTMLTEAQGLSDGHDVDDSVYDHLQAKLLKEHGVDRVEDLEVNIRGILAQMAEEKLTDTLNIYAERRMDAEMRQAELSANMDG